MVHPIVELWGLSWVAGGTAELRFDHPVLADDEVVCIPALHRGELHVSACVAGDTRASVRATQRSDLPPRREGTRLTSSRFELTGRHGADYGLRAGDDLDVFVREGIVHPAVWPDLANKVFSVELVRGSWVHLRSTIRHHAVAPAGGTAVVHAVLVDRFHRRSGERAVVDVLIEVDGTLVASLEHEAIIALPGA
jgi:acyl dehydratase